MTRFDTDRLSRHANMAMNDTLTITRPGPSTTDRATGVVTETVTAVYAGTGMVGDRVTPSLRQDGFAERPDADAECRIPKTSAAVVRSGDVVVAGGLPSVVFRVLDEVTASHSATRRFRLERTDWAIK